MSVTFSRSMPLRPAFARPRKKAESRISTRLTGGSEPRIVMGLVSPDCTGRPDWDYKGAKRQRPHQLRRGTAMKYVIWVVRFWYAAWMIPAGLEHFYHIYAQPGANSSHP